MFGVNGSVSFLWLRSACMHAQSLQSCPTLCDSINRSLSSSSVHDILQARIVKWVAMPSSRDLPNPGIKPMSPASASQSDSLLLSHQGSRWPRSIPWCIYMYICMCVCVYYIFFILSHVDGHLDCSRVLATVMWLADFR